MLWDRQTFSYITMSGSIVNGVFNVTTFLTPLDLT